MRTIALSAVAACTLALGALVGCYDDDPPRPVHPGGSTVVVSSPQPGIASPQPTVTQTPAQPAPTIINNVVPTPAPAPQAAPAPGSTINVQPRTVTVP